MRDKFPENVESIVATLVSLFRHQENHAVCEILDNATSRIEMTDYDNWDGGTEYFTLFLDLPLKVFAPIEPRLSEWENTIADKLSRVLRNMGNTQLNNVTISPILEQPPKALAFKVASVEVEHLWQPGMLRLFLSHISADKVAVSGLKSALIELGVSSFVAHEDIEPTFEWQREIEFALDSMHALVALLTLDFSSSRWTDQEVGFALGKGLLVIPVRLGLDPYGFIGKFQGAPGKLDRPGSLASGIVDLLLKNHKTAEIMREALVVALQNSRSYSTSIVVSKKLEILKSFTSDQLTRLENACKINRQVAQASGVVKRIQNIVQQFNQHETGGTQL